MEHSIFLIFLRDVRLPNALRLEVFGSNNLQVILRSRIWSHRHILVGIGNSEVVLALHHVTHLE